jgi:hypothetical protein
VRPEDQREASIRELLAKFKDGKRPETVDPILSRATELFPFVRRSTLLDYSVAVLKMLE